MRIMVRDEHVTIVLTLEFTLTVRVALNANSAMKGR